MNADRPYTAALRPSPALSPPGAGAGLKGQHAQAILEGDPQARWFEVHAENYMVAGGPRLSFLDKVRERWPLSLHGVAASLGSDGPLDPDHLRRWAGLVRRYEPALVSEHLAWSSHEGTYLNDLLPVAYTHETLTRVCDHIDAFQNAIGRTMLLENPSTYVAFAQSTYDEIDFLSEISRRTGCRLLLDANNVYVSAANHGWDAEAYLARFPMHLVDEVHLAGHSPDTDDDGHPLLIDSHDRPVADTVWALYARALALGGHKPTLIEWDDPVPDWASLEGEVIRAQTVLNAHASLPLKLAS